MSPTGPFYAGAASGSPSLSWSTVSNATGPPNGSSAIALEGPGGGGGHAYLTTSQHGFALPSYAVIEGIKLDAWVASGGTSSDDTISIQSGAKSSTATPNYGQVWPASLGQLTWGGPTSLWGQTWAPSDINATGFGAVVSAFAISGTQNELVDAVAITVYWHAAPTVIPRTKYYIYKVFDSLNRTYLGNLPKVSSDFAFPQDINTGGSQITVTCAVSADTSALPVDTLTDEAGNTLTDESNNILTNEGQQPFTGIGTSSALIRNGNLVQVWEYGYFNVNGKIMFSGIMERGSDGFGGDTGSNDVSLIIYSNGSDMDDHLVRGYPYTYTADQTQITQDTPAADYTQVGGATWIRYGQTWKVGVGVTNLAAIAFLVNGYANVTVTVYSSPSDLTTPLSSTTQVISLATATVVQFNFALPLSIVPGKSYFFTVSVDAGQNCTLYYNSATPYTLGALYSSFYGGGGGGSYDPMPGSLYFITYSGTGSTTATFSSLDPTSGMLSIIMSAYNAEGGVIQVANMQASGLSLNYGFNTNTVYQALAGALTVVPSGFYYYVDLGLDQLYFQKANTIADFVLTKGVHINELTIVRTIEYVINACYVVGKVVSGSNIYTLDTDQESVARYGLRLKVHTDNNIPDTATAHTVGSSIVKANKDEQYQTVVNIPDRTMDTTLLIPGKIIGFNGFGTYVDFLLAQIVHRDYKPGGVKLTLGILPKRESVKVEQVVRGLAALSTVTNPTSPS